MVAEAVYRDGEGRGGSGMACEVNWTFLYKGGILGGGRVERSDFADNRAP